MIRYSSTPLPRRPLQHPYVGGRGVPGVSVGAIPFLAWAATAAETTLGILLVLGIWPRKVALGSATLLFLFGTAMTISFGIKRPLDYSVFSASAGALLLSLFEVRKSPLNS